MIRVPVRLPGRRHEIVIGPGALADASRLIAGATPARRLLIITDSRVWNLHGRAIRKALGSQFHTSIVEVRPGERNKSLR
ncbi:MAG: 3-dehydroquinate synthase, partial [bacterium]